VGRLEAWARAFEGSALVRPFLEKAVGRGAAANRTVGFSRRLQLARDPMPLTDEQVAALREALDDLDGAVLTMQQVDQLLKVLGRGNPVLAAMAMRIEQAWSQVMNDCYELQDLLGIQRLTR
jgi:hypothetical protein